MTSIASEIASESKQKVNQVVVAKPTVSIKIEKEPNDTGLEIETCRSYDENQEIPSFMRRGFSMKKQYKRI